MGKPQQRLKRLDSVSGSTAGWWALRDWPGLVVAQIEQSWCFYFHPQNLWPNSHTVSMEDIERAENLYKQNQLHTYQFATRREALQAIDVFSGAIFRA
jgi:hypothetical protein